MRLTIIDEHAVPDGGFRAVHPTDGKAFRFHYISGLAAKYREHCRVNGYTQPSDQEFIDNVCANTMGATCFDLDAPTVANEFVPELVAQSRLKICRRCPSGNWNAYAGRCNLAGFSNAKYSAARCPIGHWPAITQ